MTLKSNNIKRFCTIKHKDGRMSFYVAGEIVAECPIKAVKRVTPVEKLNTVENNSTQTRQDSASC